MTLRILDRLRVTNRLVALLAGLALVGCVAFILLDIVLRQLGGSLGGTDEISGYVMAGVTAWGMAYALIEMAHVRIDFLRTRLERTGRVLLDMLSMASLAAITLLIAWQAWPVLSRTIEVGARANTPLETPLWIPQLVWWAGWAWFAIAAWALLGCAAAMLLERRLADTEGMIGARSEAEEVAP